MRQSIFHVYKSAEVQARSAYLHPFALMLLCEMVMWAWANGLPLVITETFTTIDEDQKLNRVSPSHREGRAFDAIPNNHDRSALWPKEKIAEFIAVFSKKYSAIAALGLKDGKPQLVVFHDTGTGLHFHVQINKKFAVADVINTRGNA